MTKTTKQVPAPRLRFPGFEGEWEERVMQNAFSFLGNNSLSREKLNYESGEVKNIHYGDIHTRFASHFYIDDEKVPFVTSSEEVVRFKINNYLKEGDLIIADASEDMVDIGKSIEVISLNGQKAVSGLHTILARPNSGLFSLGYLGHLFKASYVRKQIQKESQGAKVLGLSVSRLSQITLPIPTLPEQTRIAAALSSLDAVIAAHQSKQDALREHKRGLMAVLFPAEGERVPRLRFPEFEGAGEWQEKSLKALGKNLDNYRIPIEQGSRLSGKIPYYGASGVVDFVADYIFDDFLLCISEDGANLLTRVYPIAFSITGKTWVNNHAHVIKFHDDCTHVIVREYLNHIPLDDYLTGMAQPKLNKKMLEEIPIPLPSLPEQTRIAACLSSLDDLIAAQGEHIAALQEFKRGLMQGLFPAAAADPSTTPETSE